MRSCASTGLPALPVGPSAIALVSAVPAWIERLGARGQRLVSLMFPARSSPWLLPGTKSVSYATHIAAENEARRRGPTTPSSSISTEPCWRARHERLVARGRAARDAGFQLGILAGETRALLELADELGYGHEPGRSRSSGSTPRRTVFTSSSVREVMPRSRSTTGGTCACAADALLEALRRAALG